MNHRSTFFFFFFGQNPITCSIERNTQIYKFLGITKQSRSRIWDIMLVTQGDSYLD